MIASGGGKKEAVAPSGHNAQRENLIGECGLLGAQFVLLHHCPVAGDLKRGQPIARAVCEHDKAGAAGLQVHRFKAV